MRSALLPAGVLVGFAWIIGIALATRGDHRHDRIHDLQDLANRMCACKDAHCIGEVQRDVDAMDKSEVDPGADQLEAYGLDQQMKQCKKDVLRYDPR